MGLVVDCSSPEETVALGRRLGAVLKAGDVVSLSGDLGAGKTHFTKGVAAGLGKTDPSVVTSPTFVLMNSYDGRVPLRHYDLYRLEGGEMESLGFHDLRPTSAIVVEWGEKAGEALGDRLEVHFEVSGPTTRRIAFRPVGPGGRGLLERLQS